MIDFIELGPQPNYEGFLEPTHPDYTAITTIQGEIFVDQIRRTIGPEPKGAGLEVVPCRPAKGELPSITLICRYDEDIADAVDYVRRCQDHLPSFWDDVAQKLLAKRLPPNVQLKEPDMIGWIDFKELRSKLSFSEVLALYNIQLKPKGERATGYCPLPTHQGKRKTPSFSVNLKRRIWQCFGCRTGGNVLDFCARMEGFNPNNPHELRKAALKIVEKFKIDSGAPEDSPFAPSRAESPNVLVNPPIDFELKTLDPNHPYLKERGFTEETIRRFGLGYCNRGMLKGRIAIPLHDPKGKLVGYAGRLTKDENINEQNPKYRFPGEREKNGVQIEFRKSLLLYNVHNIVAPVDHLFVVEGFPAMWWLWQAEYRNTVALMGSSCSEKQAELIVDIVKPDGRVWVMPDGNEAGDSCAMSVIEQVAPYRFIRWVRLGKDRQPTDLPADELPAMFVL
jgi:DNA primase